jgi:alkylated DNA repair dioxygenase AlkB
MQTASESNAELAAPHSAKPLEERKVPHDAPWKWVLRDLSNGYATRPRTSARLAHSVDIMRRSSLKTRAESAPDLFGADPACPVGLRYQPEFLTAREEQRLLEAFGGLSLAPFQFGPFEGKRRVASFGVRYDFSDQRLHSADPFPDFIKPIIARVEGFAALAPGSVQHVLFTEYQTGAGIGWHRDKAAFDVVLGISLGSACPFRFRRKAAAGWERFTLDAAPRSLYFMTGEARSVWEHSIAPVEAPRWSITCRTMAR